MIALPSSRRWLLGGLLALLGGGLLCAALGRADWARGAWIVAALPVAAMIAADLLGGLRAGNLGVDVIALLAIGTAIGLGDALVGAIIAVMVAGGAALEEYAAARARGELSALMARAPRVAHRHAAAGMEDVAVDLVRPGDLLLVKPGEIVPVDGDIAEAAARLDESALTGEPMPVDRIVGEAARSGVMNAGGPFSLRATAAAADSTYAAVVRLVSQASGERPPMVRLADRWALGFLGFTVALGGAAWWWAGDPGRVLAVLVVATPCPLILAAPVALICGISRAARRGIIVKGGGVLERLARVRVVLFDKTGTLTTGTPRVTGVEALDGFAPMDVLRLAASLEQVSVHVVAAAIVGAARARGLALSLPAAVTEIPGGGLRGTVDGQEIVVGSAGMLEAAGLTLPASGSALRLATAAASASWIAIGGAVAGAMLLSDRIRPEAARTMRALRQAGIARLVMVSGDRRSSAEAVGAALDLDKVHADLAPADKIAAVRAERQAGIILMVGDGINDAPALAAADVGLAMGARGAAAAAESADAVLLVDRLDRVPEAIGIARRARAIAMQSILAGMGLSAAAMVAAAFGYLPPIAGALLQEAIDVAVILNALRVLRDTDTPAPLTDRAALTRLVDEHGQLRALLETMRQAAEQLEPADAPEARLRAISASLTALLLPHQAAEERLLYPELAHRMGGRDPLGGMARMHEEIVALCTRFGALVAGLDGAMAPREAQEIRRLLHGLEAVLALHLSAEEELLAHVEDLPERAG